jgi:co-chaperonin GroES (HSP10)
VSHILAKRLAVTGDRILLVAIEDTVDRTEGGIWLPDEAVDRQKSRRWKVYAHGPDVSADIGLGQEVIVDGRFAGEPMDWKGSTVRFVREHNIIATLEGE